MKTQKPCKFASLKTKIGANALISTVIIALVILTICSCLLFLLYNSKVLHIRENIAEKISDNLMSATQLILSNDNPTHNIDSIDLFGQYQDSVYIRIAPWGCFYSATLKAVYKGREKSKAFLFGASSHAYDDCALYLADLDRPLSIVGNNQINGKVYLPKAGVRAGFIDQRSFSGTHFVNGTIDTSEKTIPTLNSNFINQTDELLKLITDSTIKYSTIEPDSLNNPFKNKALIFKNKGQLRIDNIDVTGKVIIVSDSIIEVTRTSNLEDVLLVAPYIKVEEGFFGSIQAFATTSIDIENSCHLKYPSALVIQGGNDLQEAPTIKIQEGAELDGCAVGISEDPFRLKPFIKIGHNATVNGMLYSQGYLTLNGTVSGTIFANLFLETTNAATIENMLVDASITESRWQKLGNFFCILSNSRHQNIVKWLKY